MRRYAIGFVALVVLAVCDASSFAGSTSMNDRAATTAASTFDVTSTQRLVTYSQDRGFPKPGTHIVQLGFEMGTGSSTPGVVVGRTTMTGHPKANVYTYKGTSDSYVAGVGTLRTALTGKFTLRGKRIIDSAKGHVTEGLGGYAGVTGTFTTTGNNRVGARIMTYVVRGTFTFP